MADKQYAVWVYYLPSTNYVKGYYSPIFQSKRDAEIYAQSYVMNNKRRGACVVRCARGQSNCQIALNGNEFEPHYIWSKEQKKVIHNEELEKINKIIVRK